MDTIASLLVSEEIDIFAIQESKLGPNTSTDELRVSNYDLFRKDRNPSGGGVAIYAKQSLKPRLCRLPVTAALELIAVECKMSNDESITVVNIYCPPGISRNRELFLEFVDDLTTALSMLDTAKVILMGDFNVDWLELSNSRVFLADQLAEYGLNQLVDFPTHGDKLLDHLWVSDSINVSKIGQMAPVERKKPGLPQHAMIYGDIGFRQARSCLPTAPTVYRDMLDTANVDWDLIARAIVDENLVGTVAAASTVDDAAVAFQHFIQGCLDRFVPKKRVSINTSKKKPWINLEIKRQIRKRNRLWRSCKSADQTVAQAAAVHHKYVKQSCIVRKKIKQSKLQYMRDMFGNVQCNSDLWKTLRQLNGGKKTPVPDLKSETGLVSGPAEKANLLADQFDSVWSSIQTVELHGEALAFNDHPLLMDVGEAVSYLKGMNPKKAPGCDGIPNILLQKCAFALAPAVATLVNRSLKEGVVPRLWKESIICPVPKQGDLEMCVNWRPINMLNGIAKIAEIHIRNKMGEFILPRIGDKQFGFLPHRSTEDALLYVDHSVRVNMGRLGTRKQSVCITSFDVSKAFDTVPFHMLVHNLRSKFQVSAPIINWLKSYFCHRRQAVRVEGHFSSWRPVKAGVVQGSVLGPLLFAAYIDDVDTLNRQGNICVKYADDLLLISPANNVHQLETAQMAVNDIVQGVEDKGLKLNVAKSSCIICTESTLPYNLDEALSIHEQPIPQATKLKYLGAYIDPKLSWVQNAEEIYTKSKRVIGQLVRSTKPFMSRLQLKLLITTKVIPILLYAQVACYPTQRQGQLLLERVNRYVCRVITNDYQSAYVDLMDSTNISSIAQRIYVKRLLLGHRYSRKKRHQPLVILEGNGRHERAWRRSHSLQLTLPQSTHVSVNHRSALENIASIWNSISEQSAQMSYDGLRRSLQDQTFDPRTEPYQGVWRVVRTM